MAIYECTDGNADVEIEAESAEDAAQEYVDSGDWGDESKTFWITVYVTDPDGDRIRVKIQVDPIEPTCKDDGGHKWESPFEMVGGIRENPGVWGSGGGVSILEACTKCGCARTTNTWAQDPVDGEQGLESVSYEVGRFAAESLDTNEV